MHYTIEKPNAGNGFNQQETYVVGHSLGDGWTRQIVELAEGDTADNPLSTKGPIPGPKFVVYDTAPDGGITVHTYDDAAGFYESVVASAAQRESRHASMRD